MAKRDLQKRIDLPGATLTGSAIRVSGSGGGGGMAAHALFGSYHTGELDRTQATWVATDIATAIATHTAIEDAHHAKQHSITDAAHHTATGAQYSVIGLSALNTLGVLPSASDVSAAAHTLLRSDSLGGIAVSKVRAPAIDTASGGLSIAPASGTTTITGTTVVTVGVQTPLITSASNVDLVIDAGGTGSVKFPNAQTLRTVTFDGFTTPVAGWQINEHPAISGYSVLTIGKIQADEAVFSTSLTVPLIETASGNLTIQPAGDLVLNPGGNDVLPTANYDINLGAINKKYLTLHAAELWVETLVAQETIATIGGRILVGPTTTLETDLSSGATSIAVKHNNLNSGDRIYMEAAGKIEFMAVTSGYSGTGPYTYSVTRNLDGSGANQWYAGDAVLNTGQDGNGFIDLYSLYGIPRNGQTATNRSGPTIVGNVRLSSTYNDFRERWAVGSLNGLYDYATEIYGFAAGDPTATWVGLDATNGLRMMSNTTKRMEITPAGTLNINNSGGAAVITLDNSGNSYFAGVMTIGTSGEIRQGTGTLGSNYTGLRIWRDTNVGRIGGYNSNTLQWYADTDGKLYAGAGAIALDSAGLHVANSGASNGLILYRVNTFSDTYKAGRMWALSDLSPARVYLSAGRSTSDGDSTNFAGTLSLVAFNGSGSEAATVTLAGSTATVTVGGTLATGAVSVTGNITVSGTIDGVDIAAFKAAYDSHNHSGTYLALSGGTLTGTLTSRTVAPSANNTYDIGSSSNYYNAGYIRNLYIDTIVGTPSYSHEHAASDITSGTLAEARLPHTYTSAFTLDADSAGTSNYLRWLTQTATGKAWDLVARAHDYATTASQQNDLLLTFYDGSTVNLVWQIDNTTRVMDFGATPSVNGTSVSLSNHTHDASYVPTSRTVSAGAGLTGGGALSGNISLGHADTSGVGDVANSNGTVLQGITFDTYGHVQTVASYNLDNRYYTESEIGTILTGYVPTSRTVTAGAGMTGGGALSADITISHLDTSSQATVTNTGTSFIQSVTLDTYGHITALASADIGTALDSRYVNVGGDTMTGTLTVSGGSLISTFSGSAGGAIVQGISDTDTSFARAWIGHNAEWDGVGNTWNIDAIGANDAAGFLIPNNSSSIQLIFHASTGTTARTMDHATFIAGEKFRFTNAGRLGILNNSPSYEVDATGSIRATTSVLTPTITTASGSLTITSASTVVLVTGALIGSSTATFATSVAVPLVTVSTGDLTLNSASGSVAINAATGQAVNLQVAGATQWAANETRLLPRSTVTVDIGDYNRRVRTLHAAELAVETLVAQNVMATIGGRITVAPTVKLIADLANTGTATTFNTGLTSWWTLNETSGSRSDSRGSNTLTDTNTVTYNASGKQGNAASFTGSSSEKLNRSDNSSLSAGNVNFLFCAWIYPTLNNAARQAIINKGSTGTGEYRLEIDWTTSKVYWSVWNSSGTLTEVASTNTIATNTWYFVCGWHDAAGDVVGVSVNGVEATAAHSTGVRDGSGNFCLGARDTDRYYTGYIDEVGYWDAYLPSAHERRWLYNKGAGRVYADVNAQVSSTMDVDSNSLASGDFIYMAAAPGGIAQVEALRVASSATTITGGYRYTVVRNHDGSGINSWNTGDAVIDIGGAAGSGYIDLTSTSTIHSHLGPTMAVYQRSNIGVWNETVPTVALGNLRSFVDYASDAAGLAIGNDLTLTPATGFAGLTADATNGIRLFNTELKLYSGATEAVRVNSTVGLRFTTGGSPVNMVSWYNSINGYDQAYIHGDLSGGTATLNLRAVAKDVGSGAFSGVADIILSNTVTGSSIKLLANDGSVNGPNYYMTVAHTGVTIGSLGVSISPPASTSALSLTTPANQNVGMIVISAADCGANYGPHINIGRNSNGSTPASGFVYLINRGNTGYAIWPDASGNLRIGTLAPSSGNDTSGVVCGTQTSSLDTKNVVSEFTDYDEALGAIIATPLYNFTYKSGAFNSEQFTGIITDYSPVFGMDRDDKHQGGKSLNEVTAHGYEMAAIKALNKRIESQHVEILSLRAIIDEMKTALDLHMLP